ncbi:MAG: hypothetical protein IPJ40_11600 [Saprospirales bacterium]|nr:hypothetical protein [Saprospirales bacterium]
MTTLQFHCALIQLLPLPEHMPGRLSGAANSSKFSIGYITLPVADRRTAIPINLCWDWGTPTHE